MRDVDVAYAGVCAQLRMLSAGELSARRLTEIYLARIAQHDRKLNAFRLVFAAEAMRAAERADEQRADEQRAAGSSLPLLGIPIAVKEDQPIAGVPTTMGTRAVHAPAAEDGELVRRLRAAGAVIIGQTRSSELVAFIFSGAGHAGYVRNPWGTERSAGGSSGGSAAAVAAGLVSAATGSDCGGSIRIPSAYNGLFGLKPQTGRIPPAPREAIWNGLGTLGFLSRSVADSALLLSAVTEGEYGAEDPGRLRIALSTRPWSPASFPDSSTKKALASVASTLVAIGHRVVEHHPRYLDRSANRGYLPCALSTARDDAALLDDPDALETPVALLAKLGNLISPGRLAAAKRVCTEVGAAACQTFTEFDLLLSPAVPVHAPRQRDRIGLAGALGINQRGTGFASLWNVAGVPAASVPAGFSAAGLPLAAQLVGPPHSEALLFSVAAQLENHSNWTSARPPQFS